MNVVYKRRKPKHTHDPRDNREREKAHENEMARNKNNRKQESKMELLYGR